MKKLFSALLVVLVFALSFSLYSSFYGNPLTLRNTKPEIETYLSTTYPEVVFTNVTTNYNPKSHTYGGTAIAHLENSQVNITIEQFTPGEFSDDLVNQNLTKEARTELLPLIKSSFPTLETLEVWLSWDSQEQYKLDTHFSRFLPVTMGLDVQWSGPDITKDEFLDAALALHASLKEESYIISSYTFKYLFSDQAYSLHLQRPDTPRAMLLDDVRQTTK